MIELFNRILFAVSRWTAWVGMIFLMGAMAVTTVDVILRKVDNAGIFGAVDVVQLMIMGAAFLAIPYGFLSRGHVAVSLVVDQFGRRGTAAANLLAALLGAGLMGAIAWFGLDQAIMQAGYGDVSLTLGIPKTYYWIPLLTGSALSALVCVHMAVEAGYTLVTGRSALTPRRPTDAEA
jgi:TRAP-type C4-dicarboxylate transport system permease small subunit